MSEIDHLDEDSAFAAFEARDRSKDGGFVVAVRTTRIYCKPSCPARRPKRENIWFFASGAAARDAGFRPCKRCLPDDVGRDRQAVSRALALLGEADGTVSLAELAAEVGYTPHHFQRLFTREVGLSPAAYARALRAGRMEDALSEGGSVTQAIYDAGYSGPGRFYEDAGERLGMTPGAWRNGGAGVTIRWEMVETHLGRMLLAATEKGICRLSFDEDETALVRRFPAATIERGGASMRDLVAGAVAAVDNPATMPDLPLDVAGTAFQEAVWRELRKIPAGETRSYAQIAAAVGRPGAVRAAGSANGANNVAVLIPCHRVIRSDGSLGGYAYGLDRKEELLKRENRK
ncbi:bifunctional DNA-binding transcriptional regulator/O6-methylguanine-DNA methyltransferase Ada [Sphingobium sp. CR28]|uniref:bifunctional DNA-binding transcriptional regulator/O6-methylguanine-DNA methyltransferase Ada n=1 Tax=Sphingobium sp. CR28 TaxID=3400272 RepID=UPI003FEE87F0